MCEALYAWRGRQSLIGQERRAASICLEKQVASEERQAASVCKEMEAPSECPERQAASDGQERQSLTGQESNGSQGPLNTET